MQVLSSALQGHIELCRHGLPLFGGLWGFFKKTFYISPIRNSYISHTWGGFDISFLSYFFKAQDKQRSKSSLIDAVHFVFKSMEILFFSHWFFCPQDEKITMIKGTDLRSEYRHSPCYQGVIFNQSAFVSSCLQFGVLCRGRIC